MFGLKYGKTNHALKKVFDFSEPEPKSSKFCFNFKSSYNVVLISFVTIQTFENFGPVKYDEPNVDLVTLELLAFICTYSSVSCS